MELLDAIKGRRSIRSFKGDPVPRDLIIEILEAGTWAPSAKNGQQWRFTVLTGEAKISHGPIQEGDPNICRSIRERGVRLIL